MSAKAILALVALAAAIPVAASKFGYQPRERARRHSIASPGVEREAATSPRPAGGTTSPRCTRFRPGYPFWQHVFTLPDHSITFGSTVDGRLLATFPVKGDWTRQAVWADPALAHILDGQVLARTLSDRREQVALLLERAVGPVVQQLDARRCPAAECPQIRALSRRVERD